MKKHPIFTVRKDKIKRNRRRPALRVTKRYSLQSRAGVFEYSNIIKAVADYHRAIKIDPRANLSVITLLGFQPVQTTRLL